jgi:threonine synthase
MQSYVLHLECSKTGTEYSANQIHNLSEDGMPLLVRYDLDRVKQKLSKDSWYVESAPGFWRYQALLPVSNAASKISLGEVITPLIPLKESSKLLGGKPENIIVKDEGRLPTGSFKARGLGPCCFYGTSIWAETLGNTYQWKCWSCIGSLCKTSKYQSNSFLS